MYKPNVISPGGSFLIPLTVLLSGETALIHKRAAVAAGAVLLAMPLVAEAGGLRGSPSR